jgi:aryl-alcohol dehydrogenase-like predicted oxidoreductase
MKKNKFGKTDIYTSILGYGAGQVGDPKDDENIVGSFLNQIVDLGINFIDTAKGYGLSEERIGRHLSYRRNDFVLSTKVGYGIEGYQDWTYECVYEGINQALKTMRTDYIDIVHLHSCPQNTLEKGEVIEALLKSKNEGKVRAIAYSGENEALNYAINTNLFDSIQCSINIADQRVISNQLKDCIKKDLGVIAKRPLANSPWRFKTQPYGDYCEVYWQRLKEMNLDIKSDEDWKEIALRFTAFTEGISSCIVGSTNINHIKDNIKNVENGKLEDALYNYIRDSFDKNDNNWIGQI